MVVHRNNLLTYYYNKTGIELILIALITLFAALLRLYNLGTWSFWWDELNTIRDGLIFLDYGVLDRTAFRFLNYIMISNFEINEWNTRIIPAMVGIITLPILYFPIKRIYGKDIALLSIFFLAISPWHIYWSQNARFYTTLLLFYTLALLLFYIAIEEDKPLYLIISMVFMGMAVVERYTSAMIGGVIGLYVILLLLPQLSRPKGLNLRNLLLLGVPAILGILAFVPRILNIMSGFNQNWINSNPFWLLAGVVYYIGLPVLLIGSIGAIYQVVQKKKATLLLAINSIIPMIAIAVMSTFMYTANRYLFITLISWLILAAIGVKELLANSNGHAKLFGLGVLGILIFSPLSEDMLYFRYQNGNRDDWKSAFNFIQKHRQPDDLVVSANPAIGDYYLGDTTAEMSSFDINNPIYSNKRIWFVEDFNADEKWPKTHQWILENTSLMGVFDVHLQARVFTMRVYLYDPGGEKFPD
jgi:mannosyltransferase